MNFNFLYKSIFNLNTLIVIGIIFIIFLLIREFVTWYWKINQIVSLLKEIRENTKKEGKIKDIEEKNEEFVENSSTNENNKITESFPIAKIVIVLILLFIISICFYLIYSNINNIHLLNWILFKRTKGI